MAGAAPHARRARGTIKLYDATGVFPDTPNGFTWTSHPQGFDGPADPGAQQVEFSLQHDKKRLLVWRRKW
jgi:hypothetical protein